jgi:Family of unknown function (DUF6325)
MAGHPIEGGTVTLGPIEIVVLEFPEDRFTGEIAPAIADLVRRQIVTIVDAMIIRKDDDGNVAIVELENDEGDLGSFAELLSETLDLVSAEDAEEFANALPAGATAILIAFEHKWIREVRGAVQNAGGTLIADMRIPADVVEEVMAALESV